MTDDPEVELNPEGLRQAELMQARIVLQRLVGHTITDLRVEDTRIALDTDDGATYFFYGFMGQSTPEE